MDVNILRIVVTLFSFVAFIGIVRWACSHQNAAAFDEAAQLPFLDGEITVDKSAGKGSKP